MFPFVDLVSSVAIVSGDNEVFLSIRYEPNDQFSLEDLKAWLTYETTQHLKAANVDFIEYGSGDLNG